MMKEKHIDAGRLGYEYHYRFSIDEELVSHYRYELMPVENTLILEIRTNFFINTDDGGSGIIGSERFGNSNLYDGILDVYGENYLVSNLRPVVTHRLFDYWMTEDGVSKFELELADFSRRRENAPLRVKPIVVDFEVRTVQWGDESYGEVMERAIRVENMVPLCFYGYYSWDFEERAYDYERSSFMKRNMPRIRVEDADEGSKTMKSCGICSKGAIVGNEISWVTCCHRAFHSHCIVRWFMEADFCPSCGFDMFGIFDF